MANIKLEDPTVDVGDIEKYRLAFLMQFFVQHKPRFRFPRLRLQDIYQRVIQDSDPTAFCDIVARILRFLANGDSDICIDRVDQALDRFTVEKRTSYRIHVQRHRNGKPVQQLGSAARAGLLDNLIESIYDEHPDFNFTSGFNGPGTANGGRGGISSATGVGGSIDPTGGDMSVAGADDLMADGLPTAVQDFSDANITIKAGQDAQGFSYYYMDDLRLYRERPHTGISSQWDVAVGPTTSQWQLFIDSLSRNEKENDLHWFLKHELFELVRESLEGCELDQPNPELDSDCLRAKEANELSELRRLKAGSSARGVGTTTRSDANGWSTNNSSSTNKMDPTLDGSSSSKLSLTPVLASSSSFSSSTSSIGSSNTNGPKSASPSFSGGHGGSGSAPLTPGTTRNPTSAPPAIGTTGTYSSNQQTASCDSSTLSESASRQGNQLQSSWSSEASSKTIKSAANVYPADQLPSGCVKPSPPSVLSTTSSPSPASIAFSESKPADPSGGGYPKSWNSSSTPNSFDESMLSTHTAAGGAAAAAAVGGGLMEKVEYQCVSDRSSPHPAASGAPGNPETCDNFIWSQRQSAASSVAGVAVPTSAYADSNTGPGTAPPDQAHTTDPTQPTMPLASNDPTQANAVGPAALPPDLSTKLVAPLAAGIDGTPLTQEQWENRKSKIAQLEKIHSTLSKSKSASTPGAVAAAVVLQQQQQRMQLQQQQQQQLVPVSQSTCAPPCCQAQSMGQLPPVVYASGSDQQPLPSTGNFPLRPPISSTGYRMPHGDLLAQREWDRIYCPDYQREKAGDLIYAPRLPPAGCHRAVLDPAATHLEYPSSAVPPLATAYPGGPTGAVVMSSASVIMEPTPGCYQMTGAPLHQYGLSTGNNHGDVPGGPPVVMVPPNNSNLTSSGAYHHHLATTPTGNVIPMQQQAAGMKQVSHYRPPAGGTLVSDQQQQQFAGQKRPYHMPGAIQMPADCQWTSAAPGGGLAPGADMLAPTGYRFPSSSPALASMNPMASVPFTTATSTPVVTNPRGSTTTASGGTKASKKRKTSAASARNACAPSNGGAQLPVLVSTAGATTKPTAAAPVYNQMKVTSAVSGYPPTGYHTQQQQQHMLRRPMNHNAMYASSCQPMFVGQQHAGYHSVDPYLMTTNNGPVYQDMMPNGPGVLIPETRRSLTPKGSGDVYAPAPPTSCTSMRGSLPHSVKSSYVSPMANTNIPTSSAYLVHSDNASVGNGGQDIPPNFRSNQAGSPNTQNLTSTCLANLARLSQMSGPEAPHLGPTGAGSSLPPSYATRNSSSGVAGGVPPMMTGSNYSAAQPQSDSRSKSLSTAGAPMHLVESSDPVPPSPSSAKYLPSASAYSTGQLPQQQQPQPSIQVNNTFFNAQLNVQQMNYQHVSAPGSTGQMQIHFVQQQQQQQQQSHNARANTRGGASSADTSAAAVGLRTSAASDFYSSETAAGHRPPTGDAGGVYPPDPHQLSMKMSDAGSAAAPSPGMPAVSTTNAISHQHTTSTLVASANPGNYGNTSIQIMPRTPHTIQYLPTVNNSNSNASLGANGNEINTGFHQQQLSSSDIMSQNASMSNRSTVAVDSSGNNVYNMLTTSRVPVGSGGVFSDSNAGMQLIDGSSMPVNSNPALRAQQQQPPQSLSYSHQMYYSHPQQALSAPGYPQQQQQPLSAGVKPMYAATSNPTRAGLVGSGSWPAPSDAIAFEASGHYQNQQQMHHYHQQQQQQHGLTFQSADGSTVTNTRSNQLIGVPTGKPLPQAVGYAPAYASTNAAAASMDILDSSVAGDQVGLVAMPSDASHHRASMQQQQQQYFRQAPGGARTQVIYDHQQGYARGRPPPPPQQQQMYVSNTASSSSSSHASMTSNYQLTADGHMQFMMSASNSCSSSSSSMTATGPNPLINCGPPPPPPSDNDFMTSGVRIKSQQRGDEPRPGASPVTGSAPAAYRHSASAAFSSRLQQPPGRMNPAEWPSHLSAPALDPSVVDGAALADMQYSTFPGSGGPRGDELMLTQSGSGMCDSMHVPTQQPGQQVYATPSSVVQ